MPARPYSLRLDPSTISRLEEEAARARVPARTLAQELVDEGLRMRRHPIVRFVDRAAGRRATVAHRPRLAIAGVMQTVRDNDGDVAAAAAFLDLAVADLERVIAYYAEFRDEVDAEIARRLEVADREERLFLDRERLLARRSR